MTTAPRSESDSPRPRAASTGPAVSLLMCARNEQACIAASLKSLTRQEGAASSELLVVNNASHDRTAEVARDHGAIVEYEPTRGKVPALRHGITRARGAVVAIVDADTVYPNGWLRKINETFARRQRTQFAFGPTDLGLGLSPAARIVASMASSLFILPSMYLGVVWSAGFNMAGRRDALRVVLTDLPRVGLSGCAIGTAVARRFGRAAVTYVPSLIVPKAMRRYTRQGFVATSLIWTAEWSRLLLRRPLRLSEEDYYGKDT